MSDRDYYINYISAFLCFITGKVKDYRKLSKLASNDKFDFGIKYLLSKNQYKMKIY